MLDIKFVRDHADQVRRACEAKNLPATLVDEVLKSDENRRELIGQIDKIRSERNILNESLKKERTPELLQKAGDIKKSLQDLEPQLDKIEEEYRSHAYQLPNIPLEDVPVGKDESENQVIRTIGEPKKFDFTPKDHLEIGKELGLIDTETAASVTGTRFGYLMGDAALLEFALVQFVMQTLTNEKTLKEIASSVSADFNSKPFVPVVPPVMIRPEIFRRMGRLTDADKDERYYLPADDLYLIGSAEHTLGPIHMDQTLPEKEFPIRYIGFSTAFRREAGSYGKDTSGIIRVHQFDKLEMESFTIPEKSREEQDFFVALQEYFVKSLGIPYQVVAVCTGDMGKPDARQLDIECWIPSQNKYRETHTSDLMTDYQSRRLETKIQRKGGDTQYAHMNDATAIAVGRMIVAILENYQQSDGSVTVPEVLVPFMGKSKIEKKSH